MTRVLFLLTFGMVVTVPWPAGAWAADTDQELRQLRAENHLLAVTLEQRKKTIASLKKEIASLKQEIASLKKEVTATKAANTMAAVQPHRPAPVRPHHSADVSPGPLAVKSPVVLKVGDGELRVRFQLTTFYIPVAPPWERRIGYSRFLFATYQESGSAAHKKPVDGYFRVNGKAEKLTARTSKEEVLRTLDYTDNRGLNVVAVVPGSANITISLAGRSVNIPMKVVAIPLIGGGSVIATTSWPAAHTKEEVIKILGLPDERIERYLSWPETTFVDGIGYSAIDPGHGVPIEHWKYDRFPNAVISFQGDNVKAVRTVQEFMVAEK